MSICEICDYDITKTRVNVECPFTECAKSCCKTCFVKFVTDSDGSPTCMWCKRDLSTDFISRVCGANVAKEVQKIKAHKEIELYQTELPHLQDRVALIRKDNTYKKMLAIAKQEFDEYMTLAHYAHSVLRGFDMTPIKNKCKFPGIMGLMKNLNQWETGCYLCENLGFNENYIVHCYTCNTVMCDRCAVYRDRIFEANAEGCITCNTEFPSHIKVRISNYKLRKKLVTPDTYVFDAVASKLKNVSLCVALARKLKNEDPRDATAGDTPVAKVVEDRKQFVKRCPTSECRGYLSTAWKCGLCEEVFCSKCHQKKGDDHECRKDDVETAEYLKKETKPCPKCQMPISRIDGCDQIWSFCCKIAFNWKTGRIETGVIHSPEYYAYLRRFGQPIPRQQGDEGPVGGMCGGHRRFETITDLYRYMAGSYERDGMVILVRDCWNVDFKYGQDNRADQEIDNSKYGVSYLLGEITLDQWTRNVLTASRKRERALKLRDIYRTYVAVMLDMVNDYFDRGAYGDFEKLLDDHYAFANYTTTELSRVFECHGLKNTTHFIITYGNRKEREEKARLERERMEELIERRRKGAEEIARMAHMRE